MAGPQSLPATGEVNFDSEELRQLLESLPDSKTGPAGFPWTPELDNILLTYWNVKRQQDICRVLGCTSNTARNRYRELVGN